MTPQNPLQLPPNFQSLVTQLKRFVASVAFTGGWVHEPKTPAIGSTGPNNPVNHYLNIQNANPSTHQNLCTFLANGLTNATVTGPEIFAVYSYLEQSYTAIPELIHAVETQQLFIEQQQAQLKKLQSQLEDCQKRNSGKPM